MYKLRDDARASAAARLGRITASESSDKPAGDGVSEDYGVKAAGPSSAAKFKHGGAVHGDKPKARLDQIPRRATGGAVKAGKGKTNVNIIIAPQGGGGDKPAMPMPMPVPMAGPGPMPMADKPLDADPMMPPPAPGPTAASLPPGALAALAGNAPPAMPPMRKRGGRIAMEAGAGSGEGRLDKIEKYGKR